MRVPNKPKCMVKSESESIGIAFEAVKVTRIIGPPPFQQQSVSDDAIVKYPPLQSSE